MKMHEAFVLIAVNAKLENVMSRSAGIYTEELGLVAKVDEMEERGTWIEGWKSAKSHAYLRIMRVMLGNVPLESRCASGCFRPSGWMRLKRGDRESHRSRKWSVDWKTAAT